jgi:SAM-dependent methyltransferase
MRENLNTRSYWEHRFSTGDWEKNKGRNQTSNFARGQLPYLQIEKTFNGTILDFGCGLGDAIPIYKENFPDAKLLGMDISESAIEICKREYGSIGTFFQGTADDALNVDVIIASNVIEHLDDDKKIITTLLSKCNKLFVIVPYNEEPLHPEHVNKYTEKYFSGVSKYDYKIFKCHGWSFIGFKELYYGVYFKNIFRFLLGRPLVRQRKQIIFCFPGNQYIN